MWEQRNLSGGRGPSLVRRPADFKVEEDDLQTVKHVLSCDNDVAVQSWIKKSGKAKVLVADAESLSQAAIFDLNTNSSVMRPPAKIAICGWSCCTACKT